MFSPSHTVLLFGSRSISANSWPLVVMAGGVSRSTSRYSFALNGSHAHHVQAEIAATPKKVDACQARCREQRPQSIAGISTSPSSRVPGHSSPAARVAEPMCQGNARLRRVPIPGPNAVKISVVIPSQSTRRISGVAGPPRFQSPSMAGHAAARCHPRTMVKRRRTGALPAATRPRSAIVSGTPGR